MEPDGGGGGGAPRLCRGGPLIPGNVFSLEESLGFFARLSKMSRSEPPWSLIGLGNLLRGDERSREYSVEGTLKEGVTSEPVGNPP